VPALDNCHEQVVNALIKDGWSIIIQNEFYRYEQRSIYVDVRAERQANGHSENILLAEIKCFADENSYTRDFYVAVGQYLVYREMLRQLNVQAVLFLAIPLEIYDKVFDKVARNLINDLAIKLLIVSIETETIDQWIK
jgi:glucose-6-phosphate 1-dehydrogenase